MECVGRLRSRKAAGNLFEVRQTEGNELAAVETFWKETYQSSIADLIQGNARGLKSKASSHLCPLGSWRLETGCIVCRREWCMEQAALGIHIFT